MIKGSPRRTVAITGAGSGIGLSAALHYARKGWQVGLIGRGEAALADAALRVGQAGGTACVALADVSDAPALEAAAARIEAALGPIDVWVNNAGIGFYGAFADVPEEAFRRVIDVNLHGTVNGTRIALARMRARNRGVIVQILSAIAYRGVPLQSAYSTTKYGLRGFTEAVRAELINEGSAVHITMVHPPAVNTPFYSHAGSVMRKAPRPPPPVYQPEILGEAIYLAGTVRRREWRVTGETVAFSVANKIAPGLLDVLSGLVAVRVQQTQRTDVAQARDPNTFKPSSRPSGEHGPFDSESLSTSVQWWLSKSPLPVPLGLGLLAFGMLRATIRAPLKRAGGVVLRTSRERPMNKISAALVSGSALTAAALLGRRYAPSPEHPKTAAWYAALKKSPLTPPGPVFGGAWAVLYPLLGWTGYRLMTAPPSPRRTRALTAWGGNIAAIAAHPYLLFGRKDLGSSTTLLAAEAGAALALVATASRVDKTVAMAQVPLALWVAFADILNEEMWRRN